MNLILFGFKGCGKTYCGKRLAEKMRRPFVDTDHILVELYEQETGEKLSVSELFRKLEEPAFRALESRAIQQVLPLENTIIALGGGAVLDPANVEALQKIGELVYLEASPDTLKRRLLHRDPPAFLTDDDSFNTMIRERKPLYESIRARKVNVDLLDAAGVLAALRNILILEEPELTM